MKPMKSNDNNSVRACWDKAIKPKESNREQNIYMSQKSLITLES